jgi:hypothetical protein
MIKLLLMFALAMLLGCKESEAKQTEQPSNEETFPQIEVIIDTTFAAQL